METKKQLIEHLRQEIADEKVLEAMYRVPRELFLPFERRHLAYDDSAQPIGEGQTISQPYIVALMTASLTLTGTEKVLEVGTGSGYQACILAEVTRKVVTVERHPKLMETAKALFDRLQYKNIETHLAEERIGWPSDSPYDAIIVTAASPIVPQDLLDQLVDGGRMVIPVGPRYAQSLLKITRNGDTISRTPLGHCRFVPLVGKGAWEDVF